MVFIHLNIKNYIFKILITINASVGKKSFLRRYVDNFFDESITMTVSIDFFTKEFMFENTRCLIQLWDLVSQEYFRYLLVNYVMGALGTLFLIDLTQMPHMNEILEWVNIARLYDRYFPILLIGTKLDLDDLIAMNDESDLHLKNTSNMVDYTKTSAKTGFNVEKVFDILVKNLICINKY